VIAVVASRFGDDVLWLFITAAVMLAVGLFLLIAALAVTRLLRLGLTTSLGLASGFVLLFAALAISPPEGLGNVGSPFIVLMTLCATISAAILGRDRISRHAAAWSWPTAIKGLMVLLAGVAWIVAAIWYSIFASIVSALGGFVLIDLVVIVFMVVMGVAMLASARRSASGRTRLMAASAISALGLSLLSGVHYARVISTDGMGGGELLIGAAILSVSAIASLLAVVIRGPVG
jgi:hypothetical protein